MEEGHSGRSPAYGLAVDAGHHSALGGLARIRKEPISVYMRFGLEPDGSPAAPWAWQDPDSPAGRNSAP